jgi:hypothetical protein
MKHMVMILWIAVGLAGLPGVPAQPVGQKPARDPVVQEPPPVEQPAGGQAAKERLAAEKPPDAVAARTLYDQMIQAMREAETLSFVSR